MKTFAPARYVCVLAGGSVLAFSLGCGWSSPQSRHNTQTGVSESGYPAADHPLDPGSPALASMKREEKKGVAAHEMKGEPGRPSMTKEMTKTPGRDRSGEKK